jgi:hypothetical protein
MARLAVQTVHVCVASAAQIAEISFSRVADQFVIGYSHSAVEIIVLHDAPRQCGASNHGS